MNYSATELDQIVARHRAEGKRIRRMVIGIVALAGLVVGYMIRAGLTNIN